MYTDTREDSNDNLTEAARQLLEDPDLLDRAAELMTDLNLCGEELNRRLVFLAGVGGLLGEPIHLTVKGGSSGGKNTLVDKALKLLPEDEVSKIAHISPKAMSRVDGPLTGVLVIVEAEGQKGAEYSMRVAMSEDEVSNFTLVPTDKGGWEQEELSVEVAASIITTTTEAALHPENETRTYDLYIDESEEQTGNILLNSAERAAGGGPADSIEPRLDTFRDALSQLESGEVVVPFAPDLAESFPKRRLRARRDFNRLLSLIRISGLLHQEQRYRSPDGRIVADLQDYALVYPLMQEVLQASMQGLNDKALALCDLHDELVAEQKDEWLKRKQLEDEAGKRDIATRNTVHKWCKQLHELGYWDGQRRGRHNAWHHRKLRDPNEEPVVLPRPDDLDRPDLPRGPNSRVGRRTDQEDRASSAPPTPSNGKGGGEAKPDGDRGPLSSEEDWKASENPGGVGTNSSQRGNGRELGGDSAEPSSSDKPAIPTKAIRNPSEWPGAQG